MNEDTNPTDEPVTKRAFLKRAGTAVGSTATAAVIYSKNAEAINNGARVKALGNNAGIFGGVGFLGPQNRLGTISNNARGKVLRQKSDGIGRTFARVNWFNNDPTGFTRVVYLNTV
ncbi:hypothetical protein [Halococcus thailandensis]|uniref:hypothetical protein n=1 Tax=Halococcus thailandensis TaxID=335952 RepID=UPI001269054D|nr:hypothetical protein [Halococcus thailandensis]